LLDDYFECMAGAVMDHGGEVLKFIGDSLMAIFPIGAAADHPAPCPLPADACRRALAAAREALRRMAELNARRYGRGEAPLRFGIALHLGEVMYGNVGSATRLDFTVVGPAANEAARLEGMCKVLGRPVVISAELARALPEKLVSLGFHGLRGVREPHELFTLPEAG
jgi:adenylate cyclase